MAVLFTNNAEGLLNAGINGVVTTIALQAGNGALFPNPVAPDFFMGTLFNAGGAIEIVKCTARSGDTLTVVRGQEGTAAASWLAADKLDIRPTALGLANKLDLDTGGTVAGNLTISGACTVGGALSVSGVATFIGTPTVGGVAVLLSTNSRLMPAGVVFASLPGSPTLGQRAFVTDATVSNFGSIIANGGGANKMPAYHDGTNWRVG